MEGSVLGVALGPTVGLRLGFMLGLSLGAGVFVLVLLALLGGADADELLG